MKNKKKPQNKLNNAQIRPLFPTPFIVGEIPDIDMCERLEQVIRKEMSLGLGVVEAHNGVYTTNDQLHEKGRGFEELNDLIMGEAGQFMDWLQLKRDGHQIVGMWANVTTKHHRHPMHIHPNSYISGVCYLRVPENAGNLVFSDPRAGARVIEPDYHLMNEYNCGIYAHKPVKGTILLWPSWMPHGVEQGNVAEGEERIAIAFNVQMIGLIERHTSKMKFSKILEKKRAIQ